jgi:integrase
MKRKLTEEFIDALKPKSKRYIVMDTTVPWLGVRVGTRKTFVMVARFNSKHPTRRSLGKLTLDQARDKAREWHKQLSQGIDPNRPHNGSLSFGAVCDRYLSHIGQHRRVIDFENCANREFIPRWRDRPMASITKTDLLEVIDAAKARGAPYAAHNAWAHARRLWNWAIARDIVSQSPCDRVRPITIIGPKTPRQRVLSDDELRKLWKGSKRIGYPYGPLWQLLMVTGQRKSEVAGAQWCEFDLKRSLWQIPPDRFKSNATHIVPLSPLALDILASLPRNGEYLFGRVNGFSKAKRRLDKLMGDVPHFVIHDIRRTVRTRLSSLRVSYEVAERCIGHGPKGLARVYDQHRYVDEMREALDLWASALDCILCAD